MTDVLTVALAALALLGVAAVTRFLFVTLQSLVNWFRQRQSELAAKERVAVTIAQRMEANQVAVVHGVFDNVSMIQGVYDTDRESFVEIREIRAADAEDEVRRIHQGHRVVVWGG
ncbi:hypothetical protein [Spirillospora sp. CA-294931]|uniref:hypothetical protein n=1 Tax=Spirillospora sp. CA-294931 TaxID=3240042 RepID=UPI003D9012B5